MKMLTLWAAGRRAGLLVLLALGASACGAATPGAEPSALSAASETSPAGARVFADHCAGCHGKRGEGQSGTPPVMGKRALEGDGQLHTAADLFEYLKSNMPLPRQKVGSLSDEQYWAVTTYLIAANGKPVPAGGVGPENAKSVVIHP
jgi:mono/diheme cytochrome c family protein